MSNRCLTCENEILDCACSLVDGDCLTVAGSGEGMPLSISPIIDPDTNNIATSTASGLLVILPVYMRNPPRCQVFNNANTAITTEVGTPVAFNSESYDTDTMHSTVTENTRITFITAGVYFVTFDCAWAANATGDRQALIRKNGHEYMALSQKHAFATNECGHSVSVQDVFVAGDYVEALVKQDSGGNLNLLFTAGYTPYFTATFRRLPPT